MLDFKNPITEAPRDAGELQEFWDEYKKFIYPYYGNNEQSSHNILKVYSDLAQLSTTFNACIDDQNKYIFGGDLEIKEQTRPGLKVKKEKIFKAKKANKFCDILDNYGILLPQLIEVLKRVRRDLHECGNAYVHIKRVQVGQTVQYYFDVIPYQFAAILRTKREVSPRVIFCDSWDRQRWKENPPTIIPASYLHKPFVWQDRKKGMIKETVLHVKTDLGKSKIYGRSPIEPVLNWLCIEYAQGDTNCKVSFSEVVSKIAWLFEEGPKVKKKSGENGQTTFQKFVTALRTVMTNTGQAFKLPRSMVALKYPKGTTPPIMEKIDVNRDTKYIECMLTSAEFKICGRLGWYTELLGTQKVTGGISGNILINRYLTANTGTVQPEQSYYSTLIGWVFKQIAILENQPLLSEGTLKFGDKVGPLVEALRAATGKVSKVTDSNGNTVEMSNDEKLKFDNLKSQFDAVGVGVRAGVLTPQLADEIAFRKIAGLPNLSPDALEAWKIDEGYRRPITLKSQAEEEKEIEEVEDPQNPNEDAE